MVGACLAALSSASLSFIPAPPTGNMEMAAAALLSPPIVFCIRLSSISALVATLLAARVNSTLGLTRTKGAGKGLTIGEAGNASCALTPSLSCSGSGPSTASPDGGKCNWTATASNQLLLPRPLLPALPELLA
eukprot:6057010-Amphidinium_carterae.1